MSSIDERVVEMKFNNSEFANKVRGTLDALKALKDNLKMDGAARGIQEVTAATSQLQGTAGNIAGSFTAMSAIVFGALASIGAKAVSVGEQIGTALTIQPVTSGFQEYSTNLNAIQTILANTQAAGTTLVDVNKALAALNTYSDKTIYNFGEMTRAIGLFTAAGVDLDTSVAAIKGISNLAALSGTNAEKAAGAMTQLSQAISAGRVSLQDWNSVNQAGMGGTVFQRALAQTAVAMGAINRDAVKLVGPMKNVTISGKSFRESIDATAGPSWLSSDVLTATLEQFTGDLTDAELAAKGFTAAEIKSIQATAQTALLAAQDVKTITQAFDVAKETAGSGWAATWQLIFGDFEEAKKTFTSLSVTINGFINANAQARNKVLSDWKAMDFGGRTVLIDGLKYAFADLVAILRPIRDAFRSIFPATTAKQLYDFTVRFHDLMKSLRPSALTIIDLRRTFAGLFAVLDIGWTFIKAGLKFLANLFGIITKGGGGVLEFTGNIGDFLVSLRDAIKESKIFTRFFDTLAKILKGPIELIKRFVTYIAGMFDVFGGADRATQSFSSLTDVANNFREIGDQASAAWDKVLSVLNMIWDKLAPFRKSVGEFFRDMGRAVLDFLSGLSFGDILAGVGTGAFATFIVSFRKFLKNFDLKDIFGETNGFLKTLKDTLEELTDTLKAMQNALNAAAMVGIAVAIGILALSVMALARIPAGDLYKAVGAIAALVSELAGAAFVFKKLKWRDTAKLILLGIALTGLAIAVRILASAVKTLADLDWEELGKGLAGLAGILAEIAGLTRIISTQNKRMIRTGIGLVLLAAAIKILASAVKDFSDVGWEEMGKGLSGVGALLLGLGLVTRFAKTNNAGLRSGAGIILIATSVKILASAVKDIAKLSWEDIAKGLTGVSISLVAMARAMKLMPRQGLGRGVGLVLAATSLLIIGEALEKVAKLSWGNIAKGLVVMGAALLAMTLALKYIPKGAIFSAAAILVISASMLILAEAMQTIGNMDWSGIAKAVVAITAIMLIIGIFIAVAATGVGAAAMIVLAGSLIIIAGAIWILAQAMETLGAMSWSDIGAAIGGLGLLFLVLAIGGALSPLILALSIALTALAVAIGIAGVGIMAAGLGIKFFAEAMETLSQLDEAALNRVVDVLTRVIELLPLLATAIANSVVAFVTTLGEGSSKMGEALSSMIDEFIRIVRDDTPKLVEAFGDMMVACLTSIDNHLPTMMQKGADIVINVLQGITNNAGKVANAGANTIIACLNAMGKEIPRVVETGAQMIIDLINGIADTIREKGPELRAAGGNLVDAIFDGIFGGVDKNQPSLMDRFKNMATGALTSAAQALGVGSPSKKFMQLGIYVVQGFVKGLQGNKTQVTDAVNAMLGKLNDVMYDAQNRADSARQSLEKLTSARKKDYGEIQRQRNILDQANWELNKASNAYNLLSKNLTGYHHKLRLLGDRSDAVSKKLESANKRLEDARKTRDDYFASIKDEYDKLPEVTGRTNLTKYMADFQKQITDTQAFATAIQELRKRGLNDTMYKELLAKGPEAMPFIQQVLAQGVDGVKKLNELGAALDKAAGDLATSASTSLYQAGVNAAQGLVDGLKKQQKNIEAQMANIAKYMVSVIKQQLGIRSPSSVMQEIGMETAEGMAKGLQDSVSLVGRSAESLGGSAIDGMRKTLAGLSDLISSEIDSTPVISPVLDLNAIRKDASLLGAMLAVKPIDIQSQVDRARDAAIGLRDNQAILEEFAAGPGDTVSFIQNNYSPKALSTAEVYRQTNNQLSRAKGALAT